MKNNVNNAPLVSLSKMNEEDLKNYTNRISGFLNKPGATAIRVCECCIKIASA